MANVRMGGGARGVIEGVRMPRMKILYKKMIETRTEKIAMQRIQHHHWVFSSIVCVFFVP